MYVIKSWGKGERGRGERKEEKGRGNRERVSVDFKIFHAAPPFFRPLHPLSEIVPLPHQSCRGPLPQSCFGSYDHRGSRTSQISLSILHLNFLSRACIAKVPRVYHKDHYLESPAAAFALIQDVNARLPACLKNRPLNPQFLAKLSGGKAPLCSLSLVLLYSSYTVDLQLGGGEE